MPDGRLRRAAGGYFGATIAVNSDGSLLALATESKVARIDTSSGNEGNVLWEDSVPGDGMRGVEVTHEPDSAIQEVHILGQVSVPYGTGTVALTDTAGVSTMLRARGLYDAFTAAYDAADGAGKYAIDLGGDGIEWAFQYASDPTTDEIYIGTYSRSENSILICGSNPSLADKRYSLTQLSALHIGTVYFGDIIRDNQMHEEGAGSSDPVGGNKAVVYKFKTTTELPYCVSSCDASGMTVVEGHCYIDVRWAAARNPWSPRDTIRYVIAPELLLTPRADPRRHSGTATRTASMPHTTARSACTATPRTPTNGPARTPPTTASSTASATTRMSTSLGAPASPASPR